MKNVLIITKDYHLINSLFQFSRLTNFHFITASNYSEGIKLIHEQYPDFIITDLDICQENNYLKLWLIRQLTYENKIPILLLYQRLDQDLCLKIWELGINLFIQKLAQPEQLIRMLDRTFSAL
ncbi:response regulator [Cyanobacterium aponinum UTEX 3222]|uniref:response regulator n=1 Tax=Cyanobacterium aponinum TaxID=379064 RepID=UPI002B4BA5E2|nr:response regulator [Cyanobacterium aponinum]WRL37493.1 response regulator [Cyanobacterium aponinum UTEX 3221]WRL43852.1 response regulator [Cyanobacterium aponinum UTEX 3222]